MATPVAVWLSGCLFGHWTKPLPFAIRLVRLSGWHVCLSGGQVVAYIFHVCLSGCLCHSRGDTPAWSAWQCRRGACRCDRPARFGAMKSHIAQHGLPRAVIRLRHVNARACLCVCVRVWIALWCSQHVAVHIWRCCAWRCCPHILGISFEANNKDMLGISFEAKTKHSMSRYAWYQF